MSELTVVEPVVEPAVAHFVPNPPLSVTLVRDQAGLDQLKDFFQRCDKIIGLDIETTPLRDFFYRRTRTIQFGNTTEQFVIDLRAFCGGDGDALFKAQGYYGANIPASLQPVIDTIKPVLCSKEFVKVGVHLGFEYQNFYWQFGIRAWGFYDCSMAERCIWAGALGSMKQYAWFSMEQMMLRYFGVQIDKTLQESFSLECELTQSQIEYAALDTRLPIAIRKVQALVLQGETPQSLRGKDMSVFAKYLERLPPILLGDDLQEIAQIENDAIGAFEDMHVHGERLDTERWLERIARKKIEHKQVLGELDEAFLPIVGSKNEQITDEQVATADAIWKAQRVVTVEESELKKAMRKVSDPAEKLRLEKRRKSIEEARLAEKDRLKESCGDLKKRRTAIAKLAAKCEGKALINYGSTKQLLNVLTGMKGLKQLADTEDETLEKYEHIPVIKALRTFRGLAKEIGTYGVAWATQWMTKPCKAEGWLHPGDGRLHCIFNQYDAETGRSTSEKPNGQNLPQDKEVRGCFIADPPDESIRISDCCDADTEFVQLDGTYAFGGIYRCMDCGQKCETHAEEQVIVTADMSGAELRIIADLAKDPVWIGAFARDEDVHSVGTELLYPDKWPVLALPDCAYYHLNTQEDIDENPQRVLGQPKRKKCKCPEHMTYRDHNKSTNFLIAYGGGPSTLSVRIKKTLDEARELMELHKVKNTKIWAYLDHTGHMATLLKKAFDMFGRRRVFPEPTWGDATYKAKEDREEKLRLEDEERERNIADFIGVHGCKPKGAISEIDSEMYILTHRSVTSKEIANAYKALHGNIERAGKNHGIQGTNATIAKKAMGCGYCPAGKPYLWHTFPQYKAKLIKFVHDELVVQCPKRYGTQVAALIGDAFKRAAAEKMKTVVMEFEFNIASCWKK